jgi:hypothetical protein
MRFDCTSMRSGVPASLKDTVQAGQVSIRQDRNMWPGRKLPGDHRHPCSNSTPRKYPVSRKLQYFTVPVSSPPLWRMHTVVRSGMGLSSCKQAPDGEMSSRPAVQRWLRPFVFHWTSTTSAHSILSSTRRSNICRLCFHDTPITDYERPAARDLNWPGRMEEPRCDGVR